MAKIAKFLLIFLFFGILGAYDLADLERLNALKIISTERIDNGIKITFNRRVKDAEINKMIVGNASVVDISTTDGFGVKTYDIAKIAKYKPEILRVAFFNTNFRLTTKANDNELLILRTKDTNAPKTAATKGKSGNSSSNSAANSGKPAGSNSAKVAKTEPSPVPVKTKGRQKIVVIDAGHGGKDPGAVGNNLKEKAIVLNIALKTGKILAKRGYKVYYTRNSDKFINLRTRTAMANKNNADVFISVHANAAPNKKSASSFSGIETYFLSPAKSERSKNVAAAENKGDMGDMNEFSKQTFLNFLNREKIIASNKLAIDVQKYMLNSSQRKFAMKDGGVREAPFWVLVGATMPAVLVEVGYITHPSEGKTLGKSAFQDSIAQGIADGIVAYFNKNPL